MLRCTHPAKHSPTYPPGSWVQINAAYAPQGIDPLPLPLLPSLGGDPAWLRFQLPRAAVPFAADWDIFAPSGTTSSSETARANVVRWEARQPTE